MRRLFLITFCILFLLLAVLSYLSVHVLWTLLIILPLFLLGIYDILQKEHTILRNFPVIGHFRYMFESIRPEINQYFVESDIDGRPFNRLQRSIVYQRAKGELDTEPFGTKMGYEKVGYEWMLHAMYPTPPMEGDLRITVGSPQCKRPYSSSILNISAMSFGSLSKHAVMALNGGAMLDNFAHNTGEGGISPYHLEFGGDLLWQIGTGYFGCRDQDGRFNEAMFENNAHLPEVKMIEIKLSQGAKPGHGGILPAQKNTPEIASIRKVEPYRQVVSPPYHTAFSNPVEMMVFIERLRDLSGGKPIGFKLCLGQKQDFLAICQAIVSTGILPDFITVDGAEGGTGAAPLEFSNYMGTPLVNGLTYVYDALVGYGLKQDIKIFASGKVVTGFDIVRLLCLGADACNSARAMMMAVGCIQALRCNTNRCPSGVATQDPVLNAGIDVEDKKWRVANFHKETIDSVKEILSAAGLTHLSQLKRNLISRKISDDKIVTLDEIFPYVDEGCLLKKPYPKNFEKDMPADGEVTKARNYSLPE